MSRLLHSSRSPNRPSTSRVLRQVCGNQTGGHVRGSCYLRAPPLCIQRCQRRRVKYLALSESSIQVWALVLPPRNAETLPLKGQRGTLSLSKWEGYLILSMHAAEILGVSFAIQTPSRYSVRLSPRGSAVATACTSRWRSMAARGQGRARNQLGHSA